MPISDVDRNFRVNGFATPSDAHYARLAAHGFVDYKLVVDGAVDRRMRLQFRVVAYAAGKRRHAPRLRRRLERDR